MIKPRLVSLLRGDLFATASSFAAQVVLKLGASLVLTRVLKPEAYGIVTIVVSIGVVVALLADIAVTVSLVRHEDGDTPRFLNTAWTLRLGRALLNFLLMFSAAPVIAAMTHSAGRCAASTKASGPAPTATPEPDSADFSSP